MHPHLTFVALFLACGCASQTKKNVSQSFSASDVTKVIFRAAGADSAVVTSDAPNGNVEVSGIPNGGSQGYHSSDPKWRETPPERWPFGFVGQRYGAVLVISSQGEIHYIHHHYVVTDLRIRVPNGVEVVRKKRALSGSGAPDLKEP